MSRGNNLLDHAVSTFGLDTKRTGSPISYPCPSAQNFDSLQHNMTNNSAWRYVSRSGYSSTSPPGTASSGSSPNSHCYDRTPEESVDSLITSLLQIINSEDFGNNCELRLPSPNHYAAEPRCRDCTDIPCECCSKLYAMVSLMSPQVYVSSYIRNLFNESQLICRTTEMHSCRKIA